MANKVKRQLLMLWAKALAISISLLGTFICTHVVVGGQRQETVPQDTPAATTPNDPIKLKKIRIGSSASREFRKESPEEFTLSEKTPYSPTAASGISQVQESKSVENSLIREGYGNVQIGKTDTGAEKNPPLNSGNTGQVHGTKSPDGSEISIVYGPPSVTKVKESKSVEKAKIPQVYGNIQIINPEDIGKKKP
jgi:hypothetical protein